MPVAKNLAAATHVLWNYKTGRTLWVPDKEIVFSIDEQISQLLNSFS